MPVTSSISHRIKRDQSLTAGASVFLVGIRFLKIQEEAA